MENKKMKLWKKILIIVLVLCVILAIFIARKFIIITNLINKSKEYANKTNYVAVVQSLQNGNVNMLKSYNKDGDYLTTMRIYGKDIQEERGLTVYKKDSELISIIQAGEDRTALLDKDVVAGEVQVVNTLSTMGDNIQKIQFAIFSKITTDKYNNLEFYLIELDGWKMWIDKETGLILREINGGIVSERFYEFDTVTDEDIVKPE